MTDICRTAIDGTAVEQSAALDDAVHTIRIYACAPGCRARCGIAIIDCQAVEHYLPVALSVDHMLDILRSRRTLIDLSREDGLVGKFPSLEHAIDIEV